MGPDNGWEEVVQQVLRKEVVPLLNDCSSTVDSLVKGFFFPVAPWSRPRCISVAEVWRWLEFSIIRLFNFLWVHDRYVFAIYPSGV